MTWRPVFVDIGAAKSSAKVYLPSDVKRISAIQLMGYYLKGFGSTTHVHLHIKEAGNHNVMLLNEDSGTKRRGAFYACFHRPSSTDVTAEYIHDSNGLICQSFTPRNMPTLTIELTDEEGNDIDFLPQYQPSRALFWLRILTESD